METNLDGLHFIYKDGKAYVLVDDVLKRIEEIHWTLDQTIKEAKKETK